MYVCMYVCMYSQYNLRVDGQLLWQPGGRFRVRESLEADLGHDVGGPATDATAETGKAQGGGGEVSGLPESYTWDILKAYVGVRGGALGVLGCCWGCGPLGLCKALERSSWKLRRSNWVAFSRVSSCGSNLSPFGAGFAAGSSEAG